MHGLDIFSHVIGSQSHLVEPCSRSQCNASAMHDITHWLNRLSGKGAVRRVGRNASCRV